MCCGDDEGKAASVCNVVRSVFRSFFNTRPVTRNALRTGPLGTNRVTPDPDALPYLVRQRYSA